MRLITLRSRTLEFCSDEAMPLTEQIQAGHDDRWDLKRATLRWPNPANAPDASEQRILEYLDQLEERDPTSVPAELAARGPDGTLRYYRVLRAGAMCLNCHGNEASLEPEVRALLQDRYPEDRAVGYEVGALRGVIRVDIPPLQ